MTRQQSQEIIVPSVEIESKPPVNRSDNNVEFIEWPTITSYKKGYEGFQEQRETLLTLIRQQLAVLQNLSMGRTLEIARELEERLKDDTFKVMIMGQFKAGKSTLINALLHEEVLPSYGLPCTALITKIKWGGQPQALLHYQKSEDGSVRQSLEMPVEQLEQYLVISDNNLQALNNPYESVDLFSPLELCRHVELIDSPSSVLYDNRTRQRITLNYLTNVDAVLFVLNSNRLGPAISEQKAIKTIRSLGHEDIFFICNRFDVIRRRERERIRQHGLSQFGALTKRGAAGVFFISALDALEGRLDNDAQLVHKSGILPLESALETYLCQDRGRIKIQGAVSILKDSLRKARRTSSERESLLIEEYPSEHQKLRELKESRERVEKIDKLLNEFTHHANLA